MTEPRQRVLAGLAASNRYRHLAPAVLARTADWALERHGRPNDALKAAKRKLHQVFGAYAGRLGALDGLLDDLEAGGDRSALCRAVLGLHRSTAERLEFMGEFYRNLWNTIGIPGSILDLAAGLNAFSLPFSGLERSVAYTAVEIDRRMVAATERFLAVSGWRGRALWADIRDALPLDGVDAVFLFKTLPCLDRQEAGAAATLVRRLSAVPVIVASYPVRSLGGHDRNMPAAYRTHAQTMADVSGRALEYCGPPGEIVAVLSRRPRT